MRKNRKQPGKRQQFKNKISFQWGKMYFSLIVTGSLLFLYCRAAAQITPSSGVPWVKVQTARVSTTNPSDLNDPAKGNTTIQYMDGSGRALQTVNVMASPQGKDIITGVQTLDPQGRTDKSYLATPVASSSGQFQTNIETAAQNFYGDTKPYSKVAQYDSSPFNRVLKVLSPGAAFQTPTAQGTQQDYTIAGAGIRRYIFVNEYTADIAGTYADGQLIRTASKDEDGNELIEYHGSKSGRLIQQHRKDRNSSDVHITAYVYDFMGRLRFVIPPKLYNTGVNIFFATHAEGLYSFLYDSRNRLTETYKPGAGAEYTVYNELGQAVLFQDAHHRETNIWLWMKYDGHGRPVMSGTLTSSYSRGQLQGFFDNYTAPEHFEEASTSGGNLLRYTNRSFPSEISITESNVLKVEYYDQYDWVNNSALNFQHYNNNRYTNATGLSTGNMVRRLDTGVWMKSVLYRDDQNRIIQTQTQNRFGSVNCTDMVLTFNGDLLENRTVYRKPGHTDLAVSTHYTYDHEGRRLSAIQKVNGEETPLAKYEYDEVGRLTQKYLGVADGRDIITENSPQPNGDRDIAFRYVELQPGTYTAENGTYLAAIAPGPIQILNYSYTIHNQLRGINLNAAGNIDLSGGKVFGLKLDHHETGQTYNGKLNKQTWQTRSQSQRSFMYGYNGYDWISSATYTGIGSEDYGMPGIDYDANGNLVAFNRKGLASPGNWQSIDILSFNYLDAISNKLNHIVDYGNSSVGFKDNGGFGTDYTYWHNGSLKSDANKGITLIEYNHLGLEQTIHFGGTKRIENIYDAEGVKLEQRLVNGSTTHTTEYIGGLIYVNGELQTIMHDEGRVKIDGTNKRYQFFITDHLGSIRIIIERVNDTTALVQESHQGVWGEPLIGIGKEGDWDFLFQGKEYVDFEGYNVYDFHTRSYNPWTGRFNQIDGANQFASGYTGMANNPVSFIDPNGQVAFLAILAYGAISVGVNGIINTARDKPFFQNWGSAAISGMLSGGYWSAVGAGLNMHMPSYGIDLGGGFGIGISPAIALGSNGFRIGVNASFGVSTDYLSAGMSFGVGYTNMRLDANVAKGINTTVGAGLAIGNSNWNVGMYTTEFRGAGISQQVAGFRATAAGAYFAYENDHAPFDKLGNLGLAFRDGGDKFRTNAVSLGYKDWDIRLNMFTGESGGINTKDPEYPLGVHEGGSADSYRLGALSLGYKGNRIGWNTEAIRDQFQNKFAHTRVRPQAYFRRLPSGYPGSLYTSTTRFLNPYSLWTF